MYISYTDITPQAGLMMMIETPISLADIVNPENDNVAELLEDDDRKIIGQHIVQMYQKDKESRSVWETRYAECLKHVQQIVDEKSFPWTGASNVRFPMITLAAVQFHARAYPALWRSRQPVIAKVIGQDFHGVKSAQASRISRHMSYQITEEDEGFEQAFDKALIVQAVFGCAFKKTYFHYQKSHVVSELVMPSDLVVDYYATSLEDAARITQIIRLLPHQVIERQRAGVFLEDEDDGYKPNTPPSQGVVSEARDSINGVYNSGVDQDTPCDVLESHCRLDLDGDGYAEPYIVFVREHDRKLLRIVPRFYNDSVKTKEQGLDRFKSTVLSIEADHYYTKMPFIPSVDGSIYDMGFGMLLGAVSNSVDTLINQLIDAGTMSNLGGGFLSRGVKMRGGDYSFRPGEWKRTDSTAAELKDGVVPLPIREPSQTLMALMQYLVGYGDKIGMATDAMTGGEIADGQKTGATLATIKQGMQVFNGIYKRTYRALRDEFRKIHLINYRHPPKNSDLMFEYAGGREQGDFALWQDYFQTNNAVMPAADPTIASIEEVIQRDMNALQLIKTTMGGDVREATMRVLLNMEVPSPEKLLPPPGTLPPPPPPVQVQVQQLKNQNEQMKLQSRAQEHMAKLQMQIRESEVKMENLRAQAILAMARAQATGDQSIINAINAQLAIQAHEITSMKASADIIKTITDSHVAISNQEHQNERNANEGGLGGVAEATPNQGLPVSM